MIMGFRNSEFSEQEGFVQNIAFASYQSFNFDDGFSYVLKQLAHEDDQTRANLLAMYEEASNSAPAIGLQLQKSPSLLEFFESKLNPPKTNHNSQAIQSIAEKAEKFKAVHIPISVLQIGNFRKVSTHEADLVAKCYYARRRLVWETLDHSLKNKIEIQWLDILSIRAILEQNKPGILMIELKQPPTFFHEKDPKPRKHTNWELSGDFTRNQATTYRRHLLEFSPGVLDKHYEKLIQYDKRLLQLSQGPCPTLSDPYFPSNNYTDLSNGYDVRGSFTCTPAPAPVLSTHQFGNRIQLPSSDDTLSPPHEVINSQRLEDPNLAASLQVNDFATLSGIHSMSRANHVERQRAEFENLSNVANMMLTDSDPNSETVCQERHMAKVKSLCSFAGLSMEVDPAHSINTNIQVDSWHALTNGSQGQYPASNANVNLHLYGQVSDEGRLLHPQPLQYIPSLQIFNGNLETPLPNTSNPPIIPKWSGEHDYRNYHG